MVVTDDDETAYGEVVRDLEVWCQDNNFSLNINKIKELIVDYGKWRAKHAPIHSYQRDVVETELQVPLCPHH